LTRETLNVTGGARLATAGASFPSDLFHGTIGTVAASDGTSTPDQEIAEAAASTK